MIYQLEIDLNVMVTMSSQEYPKFDLKEVKSKIVELHETNEEGFSLKRRK